MQGTFKALEGFPPRMTFDAGGQHQIAAAQEIAVDAHYTLNGVTCNPRDLQPGDKVTLSGEPFVTHVDAIRDL